jgi:hypothetical protein
MMEQMFENNEVNRYSTIPGSIKRLRKNRLFRNPKLLACTSEHKIGQRSTVDYNLKEKTVLQTKIIANIPSKATEYLTAKD